ncbi:MAG TPA: metallophosphoesterase family protein [Methanothrix sp.]|nr:metallophosphoesterase family protein [Methanothrix sp.]
MIVLQIIIGCRSILGEIMSNILAISDMHLVAPLANDYSYLFSWDNIPGKDDHLLRDFIIKKFHADWIMKAGFNKSADAKTINSSYGNNTLSLKLNQVLKNATLQLDNGLSSELYANTINNSVKIYNKNYYALDLRKLIARADLVLHAGDFTSQAAYDDLVYLCAVSQCELWSIQGNNPISKSIQGSNAISKSIQGNNPISKISDVPETIFEDWFGINIGLMHSPCDYNYLIYDLNIILPEAAKKAESVVMANTGEVGADVLVFGHIHHPVVKSIRDGKGNRRLLLCPGTGSSRGLRDVSPPRPTAAMLECFNGSISSVEIITVDWPQ